MLCPTCQQSGQRSIVKIAKVNGVKPGGPPADQQPVKHFWDEDGVEHFHNPNVVITQYLCSNGHRFAERSSWQCSVCGYMACKAEVIA